MGGGVGKGGFGESGGIGVDPFAIGDYATAQAEMPVLASNAAHGTGMSTMTSNELGGAYNTGAQATYNAALQQQKNQFSELSTLAAANNAAAANEGTAAGTAAAGLGGLFGV